MLIARDWRTHTFPQCENRSCWSVSCINSVHVHRWYGCPLAVSSEKGAISTQMCLIASTLSWLAADLWNDQMLCPEPGALAGAWGQVDAASGNRNCQGRLGVCSCVVVFFSLLICLIQSASLLHDWCVCFPPLTLISASLFIPLCLFCSFWLACSLLRYPALPF